VNGVRRVRARRCVDPGTGRPAPFYRELVGTWVLGEGGEEGVDGAPDTEGEVVEEVEEQDGGGRTRRGGRGSRPRDPQPQGPTGGGGSRGLATVVVRTIEVGASAGCGWMALKGQN
jgi:hypothetical protein